ncbi:hypothetical protein EYF80_042710 [Liparis tanakae]|uniref:Uncharacterized protein n=1 Tax=Liparis tanakae TaxID=230148 RepID=A0A4Z2G0K4_9TELE|nr:hypothetical protein EYF80_042710 [Liparis tanakae]
MKKYLGVFVCEINSDTEASWLRLRALLHVTRAPPTAREGNCYLSASQTRRTPDARRVAVFPPLGRRTML